MINTLPYLEVIPFPAIKRDALTTLQVNLGYRCNLQCNHCHVNAGPNRKEIMNQKTIDDVKQFIQRSQVKTLDLTGGAPEMNPHFRDLVMFARHKGIHVIDRCNLAILDEQRDLAQFLSDYQVEVVASMPCYLEENVDAQRGKGAYELSIKGLHQLNAVGYAQDEDRVLSLVYNPTGASLPPSQIGLEQDYKKELSQRYRISFNRLLTITNMPINRFGSTLVSKEEFDAYMKLLQESYQKSNLNTVMCKTLVSVDWQGYLYDCDFNQMLDLPIKDQSRRLHIRDLDDTTVIGREITVKGHCYGCTAGQGSSCGGALS